MNKSDIKKVAYFNLAHYGDLHYSREFVKFFSSKLDVPSSYTHYKCHSVLQDIPNMRHYSSLPINIKNPNNIGLLLVDDCLLFGTWIGQEGSKWIQEDGCTLKNNYKIYKQHAKTLDIDFPTEESFIPTINYEKYRIDTIPKIDKDRNILICNGDVLSGQSRNFDMDMIVVALATKHPLCRFYVTKPITVSLPNILDVNVMIDSNGPSNLNEISYISLFCDIIVGRGSGPFCFTHVKENLLNKNKTYIVVCNTEREGHWVSMKDYTQDGAKQVWLPCGHGAEQATFDTVDGEINAKFGNR